MNEHFFTLPEEKQLRIINAAMEVFSQNEYRRAVTDDIAAKAGISKGSLFYYFHNKKSLYLFVYEYAAKLVKDQILDQHFHEITDFFELLYYAADLKLKIMEKNPYIMDFSVKAFYSKGDPVSQDLNSFHQEQTDHLYTCYFQNIDFTKFREGADPDYVIRMLTWMTDGYLHEHQRTEKPVRPGEMMMEFHRWAEMMKRLLYKEEYQNEYN